MMMSRIKHSVFAKWYWTVDFQLQIALFALMGVGLVLTMAASPPEAERLGRSTFFFVHHQFAYILGASIMMLLISLFEPRYIRRGALLIFIASIILIFVALHFGHEVKGSRRWIFNIQPSEFLKPAFVVLAGWTISEAARRQDMPGIWLALLILPITITPLLMQPDFGQTVLITIVWGAMFFIAGLRWAYIFSLGCLSGVGFFVAYHVMPHVRDRIAKFLDAGNSTGPIDTIQVDTALESFVSGGWFGKGPGEGTIKRLLPDSHTDFIFAVTGEEFGILFCLALLALFMFIIMRGFYLSARHADPFCKIASGGLVMLFGVQSCINVAVNLHLIPTKGMTLPFISYGGSSLFSLALTMGFALALTRMRPRAEVMYMPSLQERTQERQPPHHALGDLA